MTWIATAPLGLAAVVGAALAVVALARRPRGRLRWSFGLGMAGFATEAAAALALLTVTETSDQRLLGLRIHQAIGLLLMVPWAFFILALVTPWWKPLTRSGRWTLAATAAAVVAGTAALFHPSAFLVAEIEGRFHAVALGPLARAGVVVQLLSGVAILAGLEAALRASRGDARWQTKYLVLGLGGIFLVRFYFASQAALFNVILASHIATTAATFVIGSAVMAISLARDRLGSEVAVSRHVVYRSVAVSVLGLYLLAVGGIGWVLNTFGMPEELVWTSVVVFVSALALAAVMLSESVRWRIKRFVAENFYRTKYDYRQQWRHFTARLSSLLTADELGPEVLQAVADAVGTKTALLFVRDSSDGRFHPIACIGVKRPGTALGAASPLIRALDGVRHPVPLPAGCTAGILEPEETEPFTEGSVLVPLAWRGEPTGVMLIGPERTGVPYTGEDYEFLATVGEQAAGAFATAQLSETLARTREFEAFHRLTSFVMHDLKNAIAALSMLSENAIKHFDDPEFQRDAVRTVARTVERMNALLGRLSSAPGGAELRHEPLDLAALTAEAAAPFAKHDRVRLVTELAPGPMRGDAEAMGRVVHNLVRNAVQSIAGSGSVTVCSRMAGNRVELVVTDTGCGMSGEFVRKSLFSPFRTTKKGGWGIGLYETKGIVDAHGGTIEVISEEGRGTTFTISLPADAPVTQREGT